MTGWVEHHPELRRVAIRRLPRRLGRTAVDRMGHRGGHIVDLDLEVHLLPGLPGCSGHTGRS